LIVTIIDPIINEIKPTNLLFNMLDKIIPPRAIPKAKIFKGVKLLSFLIKTENKIKIVKNKIYTILE